MISIIVPCYDSCRTIERCFKSILAQTEGDFECLFINDYSSDDTADIITDLIKDDSRFKLFRQPENKGVSATRNFGISRAQRDSILFLDSDDWIEPNCVKTFSSYHKKYSTADIIVAQTSDPDKEACWKLKPGYPEIISKEQLESEIELRFNLSPVVWNRCISKDFILKNNLFFDTNLTTSEDWMWNFNALSKINQLVITYEKLYYHTTDNENSLNSRLDESARNWEKIFCILIERVEEMSLTELRHILMVCRWRLEVDDGNQAKWSEFATQIVEMLSEYDNWRELLY